MTAATAFQRAAPASQDLQPLLDRFRDAQMKVDAGMHLVGEGLDEGRTVLAEMKKLAGLPDIVVNVHSEPVVIVDQLALHVAEKRKAAALALVDIEAIRRDGGGLA